MAWPMATQRPGIHPTVSLGAGQITVGIRRNSRRIRIRLDEPDRAAFVIFQKLAITRPVHLPRPDHFRAIDVRHVVDPILSGIMRRDCSAQSQAGSRDGLPTASKRERVPRQAAGFHRR